MNSCKEAGEIDELILAIGVYIQTDWKMSRYMWSMMV